MSAKVKKIRKKRSYAIGFKKEIVRLFDQGKYSVLEISRLYSLHCSLIYGWIYKYSSFNETGYRLVEMKQSSTSKVKALEDRIRELEQTVGQKQIKIEFLEELIATAKDELNIDIKKKSSTPPSSGSSKKRQR
ncbi:MAG: transposase [Chitinophagaceae bacterium]|nr:transposase [Chitinophagaceae bacterium]